MKCARQLKQVQGGLNRTELKPVWNSKEIKLNPFEKFYTARLLPEDPLTSTSARFISRLLSNVPKSVLSPQRH